MGILNQRIIKMSEEEIIKLYKKGTHDIWSLIEDIIIKDPSRTEKELIAMYDDYCLSD
jgi:hypothetical protein